MRALIRSIAFAFLISSEFATHSSLAQVHQTPKVQSVVEAATSIPISSIPKAIATEGTRTEQDSLHPQPDTPAPPLTRIFVNNICTASSGTGCETIASGQGATAVTYSGPDVYAFVWEIGYGNGEIAKQGGALLTSSNLISKIGVCQVGSSYTTVCSSGNTIVGWRYVWNVGFWLNMNFSGNFSASDTSEVVPFNTYFANLQINYSN